MLALCEISSNKRINVQSYQPAVNGKTARPLSCDIDGEYVSLLAGDLRIERKHKATRNGVEDVIDACFVLGQTVHQDVPISFLGPILKKRFKKLRVV